MKFFITLSVIKILFFFFFKFRQIIIFFYIYINNFNYQVFVILGNEQFKRQAGRTDLAEYFNKFQEQLKPIVGGFPSLPNVGSGSFPTLPGLGGSTGSGSQSPSKREVSPKTFTEWLSQLGGQGGSNPLTGSLPFKPPSIFGQLPFVGGGGSSSSSSGSTDTSEQEP